jgi:MFS family permease
VNPSHLNSSSHTLLDAEKKFQVGDAKDASLFAGLLISAFPLIELLSGMAWDGLSDRTGRMPVLLLIGSLGTVLSFNHGVIRLEFPDCFDG